MEQSIINAVTGPAVIALVSLLVANVILSILAALKNGTFTFRKLGDFGSTRVLPLVGYFVVAALADMVEGWDAMRIAVYAGLISLYSAGMLAALKSLTGLKLPDIITEKEKKPKP